MIAPTKTTMIRTIIFDPKLEKKIFITETLIPIHTTEKPWTIEVTSEELDAPKIYSVIGSRDEILKTKNNDTFIRTLFVRE